MSWLQQFTSWIAGLKCWFTVRPWEQAIRVRFGRSIITVPPGFWLRIPFADEIFVQNVRLRVINLPVQTVSSKQGRTITLSGVVSWRIADVRAVYERLHTPEDWILNTVLAAVAETVYSEEGELSPAEISSVATDRLIRGSASELGIAIDSVSITDLAKVRTYRLITGEGNSGWSWNRVGALENTQIR